MKQWILWLVAAVRSVFTKKTESELEVVSEGPMHDVIEKRELAYKTELSLLVKYLAAQLGDDVSCSFEENGTLARIKALSETIALVNVYPKGPSRSMTYVTVRIEKRHHGLYIWFNAAFVDYKITFLQPVLTISRTPTKTPRGQ